MAWPRPGGGAPLSGRCYLAVVGPGSAAAAEREAAGRAGRAIAAAGALLVCGGLGGVMEAACRGALEAGGTTLGLLPGGDRSQGNPYLSVTVATGLGEARNALVVRSADALVAIGGGYGTLSEIALALRAGKPVTGVASWAIAGVETLATPEAAVERALERVG